MQFMPATGGYELIVTAVSPISRFRSGSPPDELAARIEGVREALLATVKQPRIALDIDISPRARARRSCRSSRSRDSGCTRRSSPGRTRREELKKVGRWLRESLAEDVATLQVVSTDSRSRGR